MLSTIKWNEVTWYSRLIAIVFFLGVVPALAFDIGMQVAQLGNEELANANAGANDKMRSSANSEYKQLVNGGEVPTSWSVYSNESDSGTESVNDEKVIFEPAARAYAANLLLSISPYQISFTAAPYDRADAFVITETLHAKLVAKARASNTYTTQTVGDNTFEVISFPGGKAGTPDAMYIRAHESGASAYLYVVYPGSSAVFRKGVALYLSTVQPLE